MNKIVDALISHPETAPRKTRLFQSGHMRLIILHLLKENEKYGYEIIKGISDLVGGGYSPSTGTVYPCLNYLKEHKFILIDQSEQNRKKYLITAQGLEYIEQQNKQLKSLIQNLNERRKVYESKHFFEIYNAIENLRSALKLQLKKDDLNEKTVKIIAEKLNETSDFIKQLQVSKEN